MRCADSAVLPPGEVPDELRLRFFMQRGVSEFSFHLSEWVTVVHVLSGGHLNAGLGIISVELRHGVVMRPFSHNVVKIKGVKRTVNCAIPDIQYLPNYFILSSL